MTSNLMKPGTLIVLDAVLVLLCGAKRLPDAARALGRPLRILKAETKDLVGERAPDDLDEKAAAQAGRQPRAREGGRQQEGRAPDSGEVASGEIVDPPQRTRD